MFSEWQDFTCLPLYEKSRLFPLTKQGTQQNPSDAFRHELPLQVGGCKGTIGPLVHLSTKGPKLAFVSMQSIKR